MAESTKQQVMEIRAALSHALGTAENALESARHEEGVAAARWERVNAAAESRRRKLAAARDERLRSIQEWHDTELAALAGAAAGAADRAAPGAAGEPWPSWEATPLPKAAELRIGRLLLPAPPGRPAPPGDQPGRPWQWDEQSPPPDPETPEVPALVQLLDHGHVVVHGDRALGDDVVAGLLLRALGTSTPGTVQVIGHDPEHLGGGLAGFAPLAPVRVLTLVAPNGLGALLDDLVAHVRRINETVLAGEYSSLRELHAATNRRPEPWRVAVLLGAGELNRHERTQLDRLLRTGAACGVHLIVHGPAVDPAPGIEVVTAAPGDGARIGSAGDLPVRLDPGPPQQTLTATCRQIAEAVAAGPAPVALDSLLPRPDEEWRESSATGLTAPLGDSPRGTRVKVTLSDYPPHALIAGPSGTGKTNFIYAWLGSLAARYSPAELAFYLLDFKEGVSFARFAPGRRDQSWLPHVRLVGVNVNTDREFGLALLRFLGGELRRRADAAKQHEVTNLAELRAEDPGGHWPRIVAVVDEFQVLLAGRDAVTTEAVDLLEDLARRGRSQGIHLVLASQDVSGIEALWGRPALVAQFSLRIALPRARRVLAEQNTAAESLPRYHAVVNSDSGATEANQIVRVPSAGDREQWSSFQHRLWRRLPKDSLPPRLFDGDARPRLADSPDFRALTPDDSSAPVALLGETIDVMSRSARTVLRRAPGRNLAVLGTRVEEACAVLATAGLSLAAQFARDGARFSIACFDPDARAAAEALHARIPDCGWYDSSNVDWLLEDAAAESTAAWPADRPHFILLYAADALPGGRTAGDQLRTVLRQGPERRLHVLGWWRGAGLLRDTLGGQGSRTDPIGAWVALDVHGSELAPYYPGAGAPNWYPRPWRALHFDRSVHRGAEVIIPYGAS
ncbi:FtsK/SpoIIIE domain-containing protein [Actinoplanes teichomyceticus]|uniref:FtsK/SpoIIIE family protein n=1 Tax=Actinoplanes teichomyceticus TaxID=1867 RepID=A0A561W9P1_ACTTI|nr:FtsK/SpoIIIE domain-containing protein [Actinoplanes teichomyceticus]TWG20591.1 FtsK/SpoIIIE family protein [Actinoplanes teichomyceticus]GIF15927.1 cell division protein FtsK [Actinoplanes teichomyceticus]